ncbi:ABC transporter ATP-binding protein [Chelatococcus asaccharovorans]|nr:ABC transporter ATP-binding protein [Chelatococcus asaccharovorans]CAH1656931.1 Glutathione import ATP-binding protein GsiA [Chelatococcus asaccharovorans]CAH1684943.1 Glutathione import ATP-binding protein GsiA [Chelatococcus asaccharovorans]
MPETKLPKPDLAPPLLSVRNLSVRFGQGSAEIGAVSDVSFTIARSATVGLVGESGSGKSVTSLAITRLFPKSAKAVIDGAIEFRGRDLVTMPEGDLRSIRGAGISYVFQDPLSALNPVRRCGEQVAESIRIHEGNIDRGQVHARVVQIFERLGLPRSRAIYDSYPHELSGGMRQRVMIAMALACKPALLVADEPTTALDVIVQKQIVDLLRDAVREFDTSLLFISHDLALVASLADEIVVMRDGKVVEYGMTDQVARNPTDPYTQQLWKAIPTLQAPPRAPLSARRPGGTSSGNDLLKVTDIRHSFVRGKGRTTAPFALDDVSLSAREGETVCVIGESGSGKSTLARCVAGLIAPDSGSILFNGHELVGATAKTWGTVRRDIQMVFQDPYASLNPRMKVADLVTEGLLINRISTAKADLRHQAIELLEMVGLKASHGDRYPHQFSGGQRQRIAIARALALRPKLLICDEPVTSLDVSVRAQIVQLLMDIQNAEGLTYLFITHDIALARQIADRAVVMKQGRVVEAGEATHVIDRPTQDYTKALRAAVPDMPAASERHPLPQALRHASRP